MFKFYFILKVNSKFDIYIYIFKGDAYTFKTVLVYLLKSYLL